MVFAHRLLYDGRDSWTRNPTRGDIFLLLRVERLEQRNVPGLLSWVPLGTDPIRGTYLCA